MTGVGLHMYISSETFVKPNESLDIKIQMNP